MQSNKIMKVFIRSNSKIKSHKVGKTGMGDEVENGIKNMSVYYFLNNRRFRFQLQQRGAVNFNNFDKHFNFTKQ